MEETRDENDSLNRLGTETQCKEERKNRLLMKELQRMNLDGREYKKLFTDRKDTGIFKNIGKGRDEWFYYKEGVNGFIGPFKDSELDLAFERREIGHSTLIKNGEDGKVSTLAFFVKKYYKLFLSKKRLPNEFQAYAKRRFSAANPVKVKFLQQAEEEAFLKQERNRRKTDSLLKPDLTFLTEMPHKDGFINENSSDEENPVKTRARANTLIGID